jgi:hypothetical protein
MEVKACISQVWKFEIFFGNRRYDFVFFKKKSFTCKTMFWKTYSNLFGGKSARNGLVAIPMHLVYKENE